MAVEFAERYGPVALITGASSGIGEGFAEELAERGLDLVVTARRIDRLRDLAARLSEQHGVKVTPYQADLGDAVAPLRLLEFTEGKDVGLVVSNAGFGLRRALLETHKPETLTTLLMVNSHAPLLLAHGFIPRLRARGKGGLIFTSSIEGAMGGPYSAAYSASKAMVNALGEALWGELAGAGIDVLALCPGNTISEASIKQGLGDATLMDDAKPSREVARLALANITEGPTYISSDFYREMTEQRVGMPRRQALLEGAAGMKGLVAMLEVNRSQEVGR